MTVATTAVEEHDVHEHAMVRLEGVRKSFGDNLVLDGIDLTVGHGEVLVIIGPSGSGKSTLLRCVNLLEPIQAGRIYLEGEEITGKGGAPVSRVRQRVGIVFQQFNLFPHLTAAHAANRANELTGGSAEPERCAVCDFHDVLSFRSALTRGGYGPSQGTSTGPTA